MTAIQSQYLALRQAGYGAAESLSAAKTIVEFRAFEADGLVRLRAEDEEENYFSVYGEPEGYVDGHGRRVSAKQEREEIIASIERDGLWICISEYFDGDEWQMADSIGMNCGYRNPLDPVANCYVPDLMRAALDRAAKHAEAVCIP